MITIFLIAATSVFAATRYWYTGGNNLAFDNNNVFFFDTTNSRIGIGTSTPSYQLDITGSGTVAYIESLSGIGVRAIGSNGNGVYATASSSTGRAVYGYNTGSGGAAIYGVGENPSCYSGYFNTDIYSDGYKVYSDANCRRQSNASSDTANCRPGEEATGGGCNCDCGSLRVRLSQPSGSVTTPTGWVCDCADCTGTTYVICCGG